MSSVMNNETSALLEKYFDTAFTAPDGIKKLRELILTLAMQGKLVPQDPTDRPASELLKAIEAEKTQLIDQKEIKQPKALLEIKKTDLPYQIPYGWEWVRLGDITEIIRGITFPGIEKSKEFALGKIACIRTANVQNEIEWEDLLFVRRTFMKKESQLLHNNDIVMSMANSRELVGKVAIIKNLPHEEATFGGFLGVIRTYQVLPMFVLCLLKTQYARATLIDSASQTTNIANVSLGKLNPFLTPLPPIEEQHRIVAEIDRLMSRCDELEKLRTDRNQKRTTVHTAAIDRLLKAQDDRAFSTAWSFITQHFSELYSVKENVTELRKVILQLAVMGKLVPQDPTDEPASELLKAIGLEKQRLVKEGKIKKSKNLPESKAEEVPYELPKGWQWSNIQKLSLKVTDGEHITPQRSESGYYLLSARNVTNQGIKLDNVDYVPQQEYERIRKRCDPEIGDILVSCSGSVGRIAIVDADEYVMVRSVALIKHEHNFINSLFLANALRSPILQSQIIEKSRTTAQSNLFLGKINELLVPIPPLTEQHRIVAKIDRLMEFCDRLEASIEATKIKQTDLLNAVMSRV